MNVDIMVENDKWNNDHSEAIKAAIEALQGFVEIKDADKSDVCFLCTNDEEVRILNKTFRGIDKPTNVLSFPTANDFEENCGCCCNNCDSKCSNDCEKESDCKCSFHDKNEQAYENDDEYDEDNDELDDEEEDLELNCENLIGSIALAFETIDREAKEQGKTFEDHLKHLTIHGMLHLLGYDHIKEEDAKEMEALEIKILNSMGIANPYQE